MRLQKYTQKGFVIEGLFCLGILAAFALPAYGDYTKRTRATEGLMLASMPKVAVAEYRTSFGKYPTGTTEEIHHALGIALPEQIKAKGVDKVTVGENGVIHISLSERAYAGGTILLEPEYHEDSYMEWHCSVEPKTSAMMRTVPVECRN